MGLTAVILTNKEPKDIGKTLDPVSFADEIIIISDHIIGSELKHPKTTTYYHSLNSDFATQRNFGLSKAREDWVLFVDDDEVVSRTLADEIKKAIQNENYSGYHLKRLDRYHHQIIRHGETGKIKIIRLARKTAGRFVRPVHEVWQIGGKIGTLKSPLIHERGERISPFIDRIALYGPTDAEELTREGKPFSFWRLLANPVGKFIVNYKLKLGFLDGYLGLFQAYLMSVQSLSVRVFQWQKP